MSRDWWYVLRHDEIETRSEELRQKFSNYEGVEWLEELPVPVIFARLKKEFPGIVKNGSETDFFWCADLEGQEEEIIEEYGSLPESPWPSNDGEGFELNFYRGYAQFSGAGTSDEVAAKLDEIFKEFGCMPFV
ncbi:MAG: hypothetical protein QG574_5256 [Cyanobacteriota bacterium erpe_2018_sw_21hr_WHONDRS-SW48-000092_B_bin.40]|jgi:hypothetical protein|nr:hypothetical protein [Cyanobacteriota bacterium erpe_2018_sw_21hr_WHONDRS-SW48-000092_B_bin.40]